MQKSQQGHSKLQNWLSYSPLLYSRLIIDSIPNLVRVNSVRWVRGITNIKKSFKFDQGHILVAGANNNTSGLEGYNGGISIFKCSLPHSEELDDDRLQPSLKLKSHWNFADEVQLIQQYGNNLERIEENNMFAFTSKRKNQIKMISTKKLLEEGVHNSNESTNCLSFQKHHQLPITSLKWGCFGGNSKLFSSSNDHTIIQWDVEKNCFERTFQYHRASVEGITPIVSYSSIWGHGPTISNENQALASASSDGFIFIWDLKSKSPAQKINPKQKQLSAIECVSENLLLSAGAGGSIKVIDIKNTRDYLYEQQIDKKQGHKGRINEIKICRYYQQQYENKESKMGKIKFTTSGSDNKVIEWKEKFQFVHEGHLSKPTFDLSHDSRLCVSAESQRNTIMIWQSGVSMTENET